MLGMIKRQGSKLIVALLKAIPTWTELQKLSQKQSGAAQCRICELPSAEL
jgi:hypothetical protein